MKQRLIDANKLMPGAEFKGQYDLVSARDIVNQPTVEVIPIDWLKKKCNEADNMGMGIDDWSVKDCYELVLEYWGKEKDGKDL